MTIWLTLFFLLIIAESLIGNFTALTISLGSLAGAIAAFFHIPLMFQIILFTIVSGGSVTFLRSELQKRFTPAITHFAGESLINEKAIVIEKIYKNKKGRIKVGGEIWFAESVSDIEEGEKVIILEINVNGMRVIPEKDLLR